MEQYKYGIFLETDMDFGDTLSKLTTYFQTKSDGNEFQISLVSPKLYKMSLGTEQGRRNDISITGPGKLPTRIIIHFPCFCNSNVTENLDKALAECELRNFTSITIFINKDELHYHLDERLIADRLFGRLMKGVDEKQSEIRIITPQKEIYESFKNKAEQMCGMRANSLPGKWIDMTNKNYGKELLDKDTMEYRWVEKLFNMSLSQMKIVKIERIQNTDVWERYLLRKNQIDRKYRCAAPVETEKYLFHGATFEECTTIERNGFTRPQEGFFSFSCAYGQGVCFQMEACTALGNCTFDDNKYKCMFLASVLTGKYTIGKKKITAPPAMDPKKPAELYDSVVDNIHSPSLFVVFSEDCTYPDYLITFKE
ncbi:UNVERIFIED_CONTAM: hypothetical protein FKN15_021310 [Acipenser sinensis]